MTHEHSGVKIQCSDLLDEAATRQANSQHQQFDYHNLHIFALIAQRYAGCDLLGKTTKKDAI